jgi:recombination associated protein RdgC
MWFRNLRIYRFAPTPALTLEAIEAALQARPLGTCGSLERCTRGWVTPRLDGVLVHAVNRQWLVALGAEEKILPAAVMRQYAAARAADIEREQGRKVGCKEMRDIVERVTEDYLPMALRRQRSTWAWIDPTSSWSCSWAPWPALRRAPCRRRFPPSRR